MKIFRISVMVVVSIFVLESTLFSSKLFLYPGFEPVRESPAYRQFKLRAVSDFSKLLYLIDRFGSSDIQILYDNHYFKASFVARVSRWFLNRNYRKETPEEWVMRWCNTSFPAGNLIWIRLPSGKFRLAREVLFEELATLEKIIAEEDLKIAEASMAKVAEIIPSNVSTIQSHKLTPEGQALSANPSKSTPRIAS